MPSRKSDLTERTEYTEEMTENLLRDLRERNLLPLRGSDLTERTESTENKSKLILIETAKPDNFVS